MDLSSLQASRSKPKFHSSKLSRNRWNVLDLMQVIGRGAIPTYLFCDIDMSWSEGLRERLAQSGHRTTVTAILLKAISIAQHNHPESRTHWLPWGMSVTFNHIVAGFTVEKMVDNESIVFFGTIQDPDLKSLEQIANELRHHANAELGEIPQLDIEHRFTRLPWLLRRLILWLGARLPAFRLQCLGATFGLSSLGKLGMKAIIPPCVCTSTFGVGEVEQRAVVRDGQIVIRPVLTVTLNFDHRFIDGGPAARFLDEVRQLMEGDLEEFVTAETKKPDTAYSGTPAAVLNTMADTIAVN